MSETILVPTEKFVTREVEIESVKFISPDKALNHIACNGGDHAHDIGKERPIAIVWAEGRGWRLCHECSKHLTERG